MTDSQGSELVRLTEAEQVVHQRLSEQESEAGVARLAATYLRVLALSRTGDAVDGVLAAHLVRELVAALPIAAGVPVARGHTDYESHARRIAADWPLAGRLSPPSEGALTAIREMLVDHERASHRARSGPDALLRQLDPARAPASPSASVRRWLVLSRRATGYAHAIKETNSPLPDPALIRRLTEELTSVLFGALAPWFVTIAAVDQMLQLEAPTEAEAQRLLAMLASPSQLSYCYDRASAGWLSVLAAADLGLMQPPGLIEVDGGFMAPDWPQGRYLARIAPERPAEVARLATRVGDSDNPRVLRILLQVALSLPEGAAAGLVPGLTRRLTTAPGFDMAAVEVGRLIGNLAAGGASLLAAKLLSTAVVAAGTEGREHAWHLQQVLAGVEAVAEAGDIAGQGLLKALKAALKVEDGPRRYSALWLPSIERRPEFGLSRVWLLANAILRLMLAAPTDRATRLTARLMATRQEVAQRIALAAVGERPDVLLDPDALVLAGSGRLGTLPEYRRALRSAWPRCGDAARASLLAYAAEAMPVVMRLDAAGVSDPSEADEAIRRWRSLLLGSVSDLLPEAWAQEFGPLQAIPDVVRPVVAWRRSGNPTQTTYLAERPAAEVVAFLDGWTEPTEPTFEGPSSTLDGLSATAGEIVPSRLAEFLPRAADIARLRPQIVAAIVGGLERSIRAGSFTAAPAAVRFALDVFESTPTTDDEWHRQLLRNVAGVIEQAAIREQLVIAEYPPARRALMAMLVRQPESGWNDRGISAGWDAGMVALNTLRGDICAALLAMLFEAGRLDQRGEVGHLSAALRAALGDPDGAVPVRAAIGMRLPWLLGHDREHQAEWVELLFGSDVPDAQQRPCWQAYLLYTGVFAETINLLGAAYERALVETPMEVADERNPRDDREQLGVHVAWAHLMGLQVEADGRWLARFYERAADPIRARVTRWVAEQAASDDADPATRARARLILEGRVAGGRVGADGSELEAISWIAPLSDHAEQVLIGIVLPALRETAGRTENEPGVTELAARLADVVPAASAETLHLLVVGDRSQSLPHVAGDALRRALASLVRSPDAVARAIATDTVHTLGAQGFLDFRDLLAGYPPPAEGNTD